MKTALVWGITGQDGSYLAEFLLEKGYRVYGVARRTSTPNTGRINHLLENEGFHLLQGDVTDTNNIYRCLGKAWESLDSLSGEKLEVYNLAAMSHVGVSFEEPYHATQVTYLGALNILDCIRNMDYLAKHTRFYQASSSEMFGGAWHRKPQGATLVFTHNSGIPLNEECYQDETTPFIPNSPYAIAKLAAHNLIRVYRESYGLFACSGILHNHESPRRGENFVTRKITKYIGQLVKACRAGAPVPTLKLGNLDAQRDWGHAKCYVRAMWLMLQQDKPDDYVVATGEAHSVRDFLVEAFSLVGANWKDFVQIDRTLYRPCEVPYLRGDASKAKQKLGWVPIISFKELVKEMVEHDINEATRV